MGGTSACAHDKHKHNFHRVYTNHTDIYIGAINPEKVSFSILVPDGCELSTWIIIEVVNIND